MAFSPSIECNSAGTFTCLPLRFELQAREPIFFPPGKAANILRGGFGLAFRSVACDSACVSASSCPYRDRCIYAGIFEPRITEGPSGLADPPRPFVFRARHLDGKRIAPGENFWFDAHLFSTSPETLAHFISAFRILAETGMGPRRGSAELRSVAALTDRRVAGNVLFANGSMAPAISAEPLIFSLGMPDQLVSKISIRFLSPTELRKSEDSATAPDFGFLFARLRDRISNLRAAYGEGMLAIDFRGMGDRARNVCLTRSSVERVAVERLSSRTSQRHTIGGFVGEVEYAGDLTEFVPFLKVGFWTGVGRHAVWGNGEMEVTIPV